MFHHEEISAVCLSQCAPFRSSWNVEIRQFLIRKSFRPLEIQYGSAERPPPTTTNTGPPFLYHWLFSQYLCFFIVFRRFGWIFYLFESVQTIAEVVDFAVYKLIGKRGRRWFLNGVWMSLKTFQRFEEILIRIARTVFLVKFHYRFLYTQLMYNLRRRNIQKAWNIEQ